MENKISDVYLLVHPDFYEEEISFELLEKWEESLDDAIQKNYFIFLTFLGFLRNHKVRKRLLDKLNSVSDNEKLILETDSLREIDHYRRQIQNSPSWVSIPNFFEERINDRTRILARGIYLDRCVSVHIRYLRESFSLLSEDNVEIFEDESLYSREYERSLNHAFQTSSLTNRILDLR